MKRFALIGFPLGHSMSPFIHRKLMEQSGVEGEYRLLEIPPEALTDRLETLWSLDGFNVTIPHKTGLLPYLEGLDQKARLFGAVNTVDRARRGHNTDCIGFLRALEGAGLPLRGRVLVCGAGGVARMIAYESALHGCEVTLATRASSLQRAAALQAEIKQSLPRAAVETCFLEEVKGGYDLLVNGTPAGMYPHVEGMPVREEAVLQCKGVFDTIYNPQKTKLLQTAGAAGIPCAGGMAMLVWQAAAAQEIWNGTRFTSAAVHTVIEQAEEKMKEQFGEKQ